MSAFTIQDELANMIAGNPAQAAPRIVYKSEDGILSCYGTTVPTDANTFAPGCKFLKVTDSGDVEYTNKGTYAAPNFQQVATVGAAFVADDGGPSPLLWDDADVLGVMLNQASGYYFFSDLLEGDLTSAASLWTVTNRTSGTLALDATEQGGVVTFDAAADAAAQGVTGQMHSIVIKPEPGTTIRMEWRCKIDEDDGRIVMGLGAVGITDWVSDDSIAVNADCALFVRDDGTTATKWSTQICDGSTAQETADEFTSDTGYETFGIKIVGDGAAAGDSITFYHNGVAGASVTDVSDMPDAVMVPTFEFNADGTDQPVCNIDWVKILVTNSTDGSRA